jgi:hypothetical protein
VAWGYPADRSVNGPGTSSAEVLKDTIAMLTLSRMAIMAIADNFPNKRFPPGIETLL